MQIQGAATGRTSNDVAHREGNAHITQVMNPIDLLTLGVIKGDSISEQKPIKLPFYRTVPLDSPCVFHDDLCMSIEEKAPGTRTTSKLFKWLPQQRLILDRCQEAVRGGIRLVKDPERTIHQVYELFGPGVLSGRLRLSCYASFCFHGI